MGTPPLSSDPTWARAVRARGRNDGHPRWYGMRQHCCNLFSYSSLFTPSSSPGDRDLDLAHVDIRNAPSWPSQDLIRDTSGISLRLGIIRSWGASHPARTYRSMHATPYVGVALVPLVFNEARSESRKGTESPLVHRAHVCEPRRLTSAPDRP